MRENNPWGFSIHVCSACNDASPIDRMLVVTPGPEYAELKFFDKRGDLTLCRTCLDSYDELSVDAAKKLDASIKELRLFLQNRKALR